MSILTIFFCCRILVHQVRNCCIDFNRDTESLSVCWFQLVELEISEMGVALVRSSLNFRKEPADSLAKILKNVAVVCVEIVTRP